MVADATQRNRQLVASVAQAHAELYLALGAKRRWPKAAFRRLFDAVVAYAQATAGDELIHRSVAEAVSGLREYLEVSYKRVPRDALAKADRLETMLFGGYDPHFEGDEPPGL